MFRFFGGLIRCARGRHERSEAKIRKVDGGYVSVCSYCRTPMRRLAKREWVKERGSR